MVAQNQAKIPKLNSFTEQNHKAWGDDICPTMHLEFHIHKQGELVCYRLLPLIGLEVYFSLLPHTHAEETLLPNQAQCQFSQC